MRTDFLHKPAGTAPMAEEVIKAENAVAVKIKATDAAYLKGTYSPSFVHEMAAQLTAEIQNRMFVAELATSDIALELVFAPGTYMEHPQGDYTYRRLLISENGRAVKDFWVRWCRVGEGPNFTVCDDVSAATVRFSLGEDVPQKVREKEYRFLVQADAEQYRTAMGRKNITEWREILKRAVKRGTLTKVTIDEKVAEHAGLIKDKLEELLGKMQTAPAPVIPEPAPEKDEAYEKAMAYMRNFVESAGAQPEGNGAVEEREQNEALAAETVIEDGEMLSEKIENVEAEIVEETLDLPKESVAEAKDADAASNLAALRAQMESELRAEMAEKERELRQRECALERQRQALANEIKEHELNRSEHENEVRRQAQNQARMEWEAQERDRLAAEARLAVEARKAEEARLAEEARKAEEAHRAEEARKAEAARVAEPQVAYTYTEKLVHLIFRRPVDPNIMSRIQSLMTDTIRYFKKETVFIKVKASIPKEDTVDLHFTQFPEEENQLLIDMIQVLGNSDLGICRVLVE